MAPGLLAGRDGVKPTPSDADGVASGPTPVLAMRISSLACGNFVPVTAPGRVLKICTRSLLVGMPLFTTAVFLMDRDAQSYFAGFAGVLAVLSNVCSLSSVILAGERDIQPGQQSLLREHWPVGAPAQPTATLALLLELYLFVAIFLLTAFSTGYPADSFVAWIGSPTSAKIIVKIVTIVEASAMFVTFLGILDVMLRVGMWMTASAHAIRDFGDEMARLAMEQRDARTRVQGRGTGLPVRRTGRLDAWDEEHAVDRAEAAFARAQALVSRMNATFETPVTLIVVVGAFYCVLTAMYLSEGDNRDITYSALYYTLSYAVCPIVIIIWTARVGDVWLATKAEVLTPARLPPLTVRMGETRATAFLHGMDRTTLSFELAHVHITTFLVVRFLFGLLVAFGLTALHIAHEAHREHIIAHEVAEAILDHTSGHHLRG